MGKPEFPNNQHVVPKTYLKHWQISKDKKIVFGIDRTNKFNSGVKKFGINSGIFTDDKHYNHEMFEDPYILEKIFALKIEPTYENIMGEVNSELELSDKIRGEIINWLCLSKLRSPIIRFTLEEAMNRSIELIAAWRNETVDKKMRTWIDSYSKEVAKKVQLRTFSEREVIEKHLNLYHETLSKKHWRILKAPPELQFWTNDNPGFSPNTDERFASTDPFHATIELNDDSIVYFPLSPKYCLEITPFNTPGFNLYNMKIKYEEIAPEYVKIINHGVFDTCSKIVISSIKESLEKYTIQFK